ncbi:dynamin family protein [Sulfurihydrogenibium sp.]|uniref:dynamin family protein n=1 Tax=Sulfurihydrogenibium sp. TaxID=2053621 RepID=UPI0026215942|nr:dynamin family protein [Sulfurihydrogenibium sp.]
MNVLKVNSVLPNLKEEIEKYNIVVYDGEKHLYEFLEEAGEFIPNNIKLKVKFCKNVKYSKTVSVILNTRVLRFFKKRRDLRNIPDLYSLLQEISKYKKDFRKINTKDIVIVESNNEKELFDTIQQFINLGINISVYSRKEFEDIQKVEKFTKNLDKLDKIVDKFYKNIEPMDFDNKLLKNAKKDIVKNLKTIKNSIPKLKEQDVKVCIVATKKAGKSMLINCFLKNEYAPTSAELPTPCIIKYTPNKNSDSIELYQLNYEYKNENGKSLSELKVERKYLGNYKSPEEVKKALNIVFKSVNIKGERTLDFEIKYPVSKDSNLNYVIYDTPGPDLAGSEHGIGLKEVIKDSDVVIFVIDYTKYAIESEVELFGKVLSLFDEKENELIVAVNKMDTMYKDQLSEKISSRVADFVREKYKALEEKIIEKAKEEGKNIENFEIISIPISAMWYFHLIKTAEKYPQIKEKLEHIKDIEDDSIHSYIDTITNIMSILKRTYKNTSPTYEDALSLSNFETLLRYTHHAVQEKVYKRKLSNPANEIDTAIKNIVTIINSGEILTSQKNNKMLKLTTKFIEDVYDKVYARS